MRELGLTEVSIKDGETEIRLKKDIAAPAAYVPAAPVQQSPVKDAEDAGEDMINTFAAYTEVKAPLIGIFYDSPSPEAPPYVRVGSQVKKGDTLCIVEAMKMMNEICAECDGTVIDVCAANGAMVEYGQILFKISEQL